MRWAGDLSPATVSNHCGAFAENYDPAAHNDRMPISLGSICPTCSRSVPACTPPRGQNRVRFDRETVISPVGLCRRTLFSTTCDKPTAPLTTVSRSKATQKPLKIAQFPPKIKRKGPWLLRHVPRVIRSNPGLFRSPRSSATLWLRRLKHSRVKDKRLVLFDLQLAHAWMERIEQNIPLHSYRHRRNLDRQRRARANPCIAEFPRRFS